jgi:hypothetical protein
MSRLLTRFVFSAIIPLTMIVGSTMAEEEAQDDVSKALDSTATQWSFQFAYQNRPNYKDDYVDGKQRPEGSTDFIQMRIVAPFVFDSFTLLPRLTQRHYENAAGESGIGNTELFGLIIPKSWDWGTGRGGLGPLVTAPDDDQVA